MRPVLLLLFIAVCSVGAEILFKLNAQGTPVYRGRADPIVTPGALAGHSHKVFGCSGFSLGTKGQSPEAYYDEIMRSSCTTITVSADKSAYWVPDLYYHWPNGTFSLIPNGGPIIYYFGRGGKKGGSQENVRFTAFPRGFRMLAGNLHRRSYNDSSLADRAISFACLYGGGQTPGFPAPDKRCDGGLRAHVWFPQCWDGVNVDSPNHMDHVAYPDGVGQGDCPASHPVRIPGIFLEVLFSVSAFPHGEGVQPFVLSNGDPTGYGYHGDFLNGWDIPILQAAMDDRDSCAATNTNNGNDIRACLPLRPHVKENNPDGSCILDKHIVLTEDVGRGHLISHLPGNNPVTYGPEPAVPLPGAGPQKIDPSIFRVFIKSKTTGLFVTSYASRDPLTANITQAQLSYPQVFLFIPTGATTYGIQSEATMDWATNNGNSGSSAMTANKNNPGAWEQFSITFSGGATRPNRAGVVSSILSVGNGKWVTVDAQGVLYSNGAAANEEFVLIDANDVDETRGTVPTSVPPPSTGSRTSSTGSSSGSSTGASTGASSSPAPTTDGQPSDPSSPASILSFSLFAAAVAFFSLF